MGNSFDNDLKVFFEKEAFSFKGNKDIPICKRCFYCKNKRFTDDEAKMLSDPELTFEQFQIMDMGFESHDGFQSDDAFKCPGGISTVEHNARSNQIS